MPFDANQAILPAMTDMVLVCGECSKRLAIDPRAVGRSFRCPDCRALVEVPFPSLYFQCQSCKAGMYAAVELAGEVLDCPVCRKPLTVPAESRMFCWNCMVQLVMDEATFDSMAGHSTRCPQCKAAIDVPRLPGR